MVPLLQIITGMTRLALLAASIALFAASSARASRTGQVDVSASVVYSAVLRPVEVVSVRQIASAGRTRMVASVRPGAGPVLIEQRGGAPVQLVSPAVGTGGPVRVACGPDLTFHVRARFRRRAAGGPCPFASVEAEA
jgi:hypothetical protein